LPHRRRRRYSRLFLHFTNCTYFVGGSFEMDIFSRSLLWEDDPGTASEESAQEIPAILSSTPRLTRDDKNNAQKDKSGYKKSSNYIGRMHYYALPNSAAQCSFTQRTTPRRKEGKDSPHGTSQADTPENPIPPMFHNPDKSGPPPCHPHQRA
jgi:hypothetical protein